LVVKYANTGGATAEELMKAKMVKLFSLLLFDLKDFQHFLFSNKFLICKRKHRHQILNVHQQ
jgi:hypothetical protein